MHNDLPSLNALKTFDVVARRGSITAAAEELCLTQGAVSHQIRTLEQQLGFLLFHREARRIRLTQQGADLLPIVRNVLSELRIKIADLREQSEDMATVLTVLTTTYFASRWLLPRLHGFMRIAPGVSVRLVHGALEDTHSPAHDIEICWGSLATLAKGAELLFEAALTPVCAPELVNNAARSELLSSHPFLHDDTARGVWRDWLRQGGFDPIKAQMGTTISDPNLRMSAAMDGHGFTLADYLVAQELSDERLTAPFDFRMLGYGYFIQTLKTTDTINKFHGFLIEECEAYRNEAMNFT